MYLHLGNQVIALQKSVIGVFDMDTATWSHRTRETLEKLEQAGQVENAAGTELPKSFVLCSLAAARHVISPSSTPQHYINAARPADWKISDRGAARKEANHARYYR